MPSEKSKRQMRSETQRLREMREDGVAQVPVDSSEIEPEDEAACNEAIRKAKEKLREIHLKELERAESRGTASLGRVATPISRGVISGRSTRNAGNKN